VKRVLALLLLAQPASADVCRVVDVDFTPTDELQIVAWIEQADGTFVDTIYITNKTGIYGIGNRPGRYDFNTGPVVKDMWPYGRRVNTFPVWAHRHGKTWPQVQFQDGNENGLSHAINVSSPEHQPFCRPMHATDDKALWDAGTCASAGNVFTDKGVFSATALSLYPPRVDVHRDPSLDSPSVDLYKSMNPFDAITHATPASGEATETSWALPADLADGDYVVWIEVSKTFDFNDTYNSTVYPSPVVAYGDFGKAYRGQPSIVYSVPITVGAAKTTAHSLSYVGYGDVDGGTGTLHPPDATITTDTPGTGASRLQIIPGSTGDRVEVCARPEANTAPPGAITDLAVTEITSFTASLAFTAPGTALHTCTGQPSRVAGYEVRYRAGAEMTAANFADSSLAAVAMVPVDAGTSQMFELDGLLPQTDYWVGVRAYDDCRNYSDLAITTLTTPYTQSGEVDACFVATAAYGSLMANDVELLRSFRDSVLRSTVFGELAIETYYTFGPPVAGVVGESELLRATARAALRPVIEKVRAR
jgi:hypothetical protein